MGCGCGKSFTPTNNTGVTIQANGQGAQYNQPAQVYRAQSVPTSGAPVFAPVARPQV